MTHRLALLAACFTMSLLPRAHATPPGFDEHFEIRRNAAGQATWILIRPRAMASTARAAEGVRTDLKALYTDSARVEQDMDRLAAGAGLGTLDVAKLRTSVRTLRGQSLDRLLSHPKLKTFYATVDREIASAERDLVNPFNVVANVRDPLYFYKASVAEALIKKLLQVAENFFADNVPALSVAHFIMARIDHWLSERQDYYRHMAIAYLNAAGAEALGLTEQEGRWLLSSIYSSGIGWKDILAASQLKASWDTYGVDGLAADMKTINWRFGQFKPTWAGDLGRLGYAFEKIQIQTQTARLERIVNLRKGRTKFTSEPALTWDAGRPERVRNERVLLMAAEMGAHFVPYLVGPIKSEFLKLLRSLYAPQIPTEGALVGHLLSSGESDSAAQIADQSINPFVMTELAN